MGNLEINKDFKRLVYTESDGSVLAIDVRTSLDQPELQFNTGTGAGAGQWVFVIGDDLRELLTALRDMVGDLGI